MMAHTVKYELLFNNANKVKANNSLIHISVTVQLSICTGKQ
jgi:hypothetical protein